VALTSGSPEQVPQSSTQPQSSIQKPDAGRQFHGPLAWIGVAEPHANQDSILGIKDNQIQFHLAMIDKLETPLPLPEPEADAPVEESEEIDDLASITIDDTVNQDKLSPAELQRHIANNRYPLHPLVLTSVGSLRHWRVEI
jgi:hypothetical protein